MKIDNAKLTISKILLDCLENLMKACFESQ